MIKSNQTNLSVLLEVLILSVLFLTPLLPYSFRLGFEQIKVLFLIGGVGVIGLVYLLTNYESQFRWSFVKVAAVVFIIWLGISAFWGWDVEASLVGDGPYFQGLVLYIFLLIFFLVVATVRIKLEKMAVVLTISSLVVAILAIRDFILLTFFDEFVLTYSGRVVSSFGQPNLYAGFLVLVLPLSFYLSLSLRSRKEQLIVGLMMVFSVVAILISQSRDAIAILVLLGVILVVRKVYPLRQRIFQNPLTLGLVSGLMILGLIGGASFLVRIVKQEIITPQSNQWLLEQSPEKRIYIWAIAKEMVGQRVWFGYGLENFDLGFANYFKGLNFDTLNNPAAHSLKNLSVNRAHSYPVDLVVFSGVVGLGSWLILIFGLFKKGKSKILKFCLTIFLIWSSVQIPSVVQLLFFWLIAGLIEKSTTD